MMKWLNKRNTAELFLMAISIFLICFLVPCWYLNDLKLSNSRYEVLVMKYEQVKECDGLKTFVFACDPVRYSKEGMGEGFVATLELDGHQLKKLITLNRQGEYGAELFIEPITTD